MVAMVDITGERFGMLTAICSEYSDKHGGRMWLCYCDCGNEKDVSINSLRRGKTTSCGCKKIKHGHASNTEHEGCSNRYKSSPTYNTWRRMIDRCTNPNHRNYKRYGGRGINVCSEWRNDFSAFLNDVGERPQGKTLDRINNDMGYEPSNCKWSTPKEQAQNRRSRYAS